MADTVTPLYPDQGSLGRCDAAREGRYANDTKDTDRRCVFSARYLVNGRRLCTKHASGVALRVLLDGTRERDRVERDLTGVLREARDLLANLADAVREVQPNRPLAELDAVFELTSSVKRWRWVLEEVERADAFLARHREDGEVLREQGVADGEPLREPSS